ncbi:hypothetical protein [Stenotrophomonas sp. MMGLT7]|uniref:hypothetical protein n=1 Tax=Stenotrophomonas sp. MMGLT7 TaxID=2901227 RepID=UPI001E5BB2A0|nr:hypothetical protein [Stenotrophomonas sp. MMGLT7]MCD7096971.1 hypothetical protein [Stenotrophomonas sp. MMGLT7]
MNRTTKTIWYKRVTIQGHKTTLRTLLASALNDRPLAGERLMNMANDAENIGINLYQTQEDLLFGQFICFLPGMRQPVMTLENGKTAFDLATIAAETTDDGKKREFLESIGYFGIVDNHLMLVQTKALSSREFEDYLTWLLTNATTTLAKGTMLTLDDPAATKARKTAAQKNIRGVTIGTQLQAVAAPEIVKGDAVSKYELKGGAFDALRSLLGAEIFDKLSLEESLEEDNIELQLTVRVKGRRVASDDGQKFLRAVGRATRHIDPRDYAIELERNGELKGSDLKLHRTVGVATHQQGGLIDETAMMAHMIAWLKELNEKGYIDP